MFGIPIDSAANLLSDNQSVMNNSSKLEYSLYFRHNSIAYHATRWSVAAGVLRTVRINIRYNLVDAFTKRRSVVKRSELFGG